MPCTDFPLLNSRKLCKPRGIALMFMACAKSPFLVGILSAMSSMEGEETGVSSGSHCEIFHN